MNRWWQHESLVADETGLLLDQVPLVNLADQYGTPLYVYSRATIQRQIAQLQALLAQVSHCAMIYYAMKANRHPAVLQAVRAMATVEAARWVGVGIDACSLREVDWALGHEFAVEDISFNAGMLATSELAQLAARRVHCTLDSFSALRRYGALVPRGTAVGLRFDPGVIASYGHNPQTAYSQSKFGFEADEWEAALATATQAGLVVDTLHIHIGWGLAEESANLVGQAFARLSSLARRIPGLQTINIGGGLGGRYQKTDQPLQLCTWQRLIEQHLTPLAVVIACEPGTYIAAPAGVLIVEVNTVEKRRGIHWLGVDAGFAIGPCPALYNIPLAAVALERPLAPCTQRYHVAGNMNESCDIWAKQQLLPEIQEGERLALLPAGAYGASMASDHCLRGLVREVVV
ncbi:MAG: hypothetical protein U0350_28870 [Caldilineaceae bacterium]